MNIEKIKPIPKTIEKKIRALDQQWYDQVSHVRFFSYLVIQKGELVKITVAVRSHKKSWYFKQVAVHGLHSEKCYVKDMEYSYYGSGFCVGWYAEGLQNYRRSYETEGWDKADAKYYDPFAPVVNLNVIDKFPAFKYSAYKLFRGSDILSYLRLYEQYPQEEYLLKLRLGRYWNSKTILQRAAKDKAFCKWLARNREKLSGERFYYVSTVMKAYTTGKELDEIQNFEQKKKMLYHDEYMKVIRKYFKAKDLPKLFAYTEKQQISLSLYRDYMTACDYLKLDMTEEKNLLPHDFKLWHDRRIEEYRILKAADEARAEQERAERMAQIEAERNEKDLARAIQHNERYFNFVRIAEKYRSLQQTHGAFVIILASEPADLVREGIALHHCVGHMNYDEKFANEQSLIFFLRKADAPDVPFFTMEYSIRQKKILQCYGNKNTSPNDEITNYLNKIWLPYANKTIQKIKIAA